jgi:urease accessory protein
VAAAMSLWTALAGIASAALRLLRMTHDDAQAMLATLRPLCASLARQAIAADPLAIAASAPRAEIWAMRHEQAVVRLFAS